MSNGKDSVSDQAARTVAIGTLERTLLVEAGAGVGKTALMAGRVAMLFASGIKPEAIAAVTFTELAASELQARVRRYCEMLAENAVPLELSGSLPDGLSADEIASMQAALRDIDAITCTTIHGFCQRLITPYPLEANIDPGATVMDAQEADVLFRETLNTWLRDALDGERTQILSELLYRDPQRCHELLASIAERLRQNWTLNVPTCDGDLELSVQAFVNAAHGFAEFTTAAPGSEIETNQRAACFLEMAEQLADFPLSPVEARLVSILSQEAHTDLCKADGGFRHFKMKGKWAAVAKAAGLSKVQGAELFEQANELHEACCSSWTALKQIGASQILSLLVEELRAAISVYQHRKASAALIDFEDLTRAARDMLHKHGDVRKALAARYTHILVDEFQDTDPAQAEIFWLLAAADEPASEKHWSETKLRPGALFLVGDPKQSIYRFRGADASSYRQVRSALLRQDPASVVRITTNFRSCAPIISFVNEAFRGPMSEESQPGFAPLDSFYAAPKRGPCVAAIEVNCTSGDGRVSAEAIRDCEAEVIAEVCAGLIGTHILANADGGPRSCRASDIALLAPTGTDLWRYEEALERAGIPVATQAGKGFYQRQEVHDLIALTRVLANPSDTLALLAFLRSPLVGLTEEDLLDLAWETKPGCLSPRLSLFADLEEVRHPVARAVLHDLQALRRKANSTTPHALLAEAYATFHVRPHLRVRLGSQSARALANAEAFLDLARSYSVRGLVSFSEAVTRSWTDGARAPEGQAEATEGAVSLFTVHASKGLEWPIVIPINMNTRRTPRPGPFVERGVSTLHAKILGKAPSGYEEARASEDEEERREGQRLWYVAATRARELLLLPRHDPASDSKSWISLVDLGLAALPMLQVPTGEARADPDQDWTVAHAPDRQTFIDQNQKLMEATTRIVWRAPSQTEVVPMYLEGSFGILDEVTAVSPIVGGKGRGSLLHKLIEELLTGEIGDDDGELRGRARELAEQLEAPDIDVEEVVVSALRALSLPEIASLRPRMLPEVNVFAASHEGLVERISSGVVDALVLDDAGGVDTVIDWKSDLAPSAATLQHYRSQVEQYMEATGAKRGLIVLATIGKVISVGTPATDH